MKGGKADKPRKSASSKPSHPRAGADKSKGGANRPANVAPPKGSRKRPGSGGLSSSGED